MDILAPQPQESGTCLACDQMIWEADERYTKYSSLHLDWTKDQQEEIISQIGKIIKQAIEIAISEAQMARRKMSVSQMTGCTVLE